MIAGVNAWRFRVPTTRPIWLKDQPHSIREGILLEREGRWAEASPLPGFSSDTIEDVLTAIRGEKTRSSSFEFAMSMLDHPMTLPASVPYNRLLMGEREQVLRSVAEIRTGTQATVKLKVGRQDLQTDIQWVKEISNQLPDHTKLRLDANRSWTFDESVTFAESISEIEIEYIEEPLQDSQQLEALYQRTGIRYALDETLLETNDLKSWPNSTALICKPTLLGGRPVIERLAHTGKPLVFSSAFESGIGIFRIVQLAEEFSPDLAAGLDTLDWLTDDLLMESPTKQNGLFHFLKKPVPDFKHLEPIQ